MAGVTFEGRVSHRRDVVLDPDAALLDGVIVPHAITELGRTETRQKVFQWWRLRHHTEGNPILGPRPISTEGAHDRHRSRDDGICCTFCQHDTITAETSFFADRFSVGLDNVIRLFSELARCNIIL